MSALRPILLACLIALMPAPAVGGAWTRAEGDGVLISTIGRQGNPTTFFTLPGGSEDKASAQLYVEYGLFEDITVGGSLFTETGLGQEDVTGSASAGLFLRKRVYRDDEGNVASVQIGVAAPIDRLFGSTFANSTSDNPAEVRIFALGGTSWWGDWGSIFISTAAGFAWRGEGEADEARAELVTGYKKHPCCLPILSFYATHSFGPGEASLKIAPSFAYSPPPSEEEIALAAEEEREPQRKTTYQLGLSYDMLDGDGSLGVTFSIWRKF
ncbi:MAG: hypothetical protein AAFS07_04030 [Pseudomonadota bacterium]